MSEIRRTLFWAFYVLGTVILSCLGVFAKYSDDLHCIFMAFPLKILVKPSKWLVTPRTRECKTSLGRHRMSGQVINFWEWHIAKLNDHRTRLEDRGVLESFLHHAG